MSGDILETFPALNALVAFTHAFTLRQPEVPVDADKAIALERLRPSFEDAIAGLGYTSEELVTGEQVHGNRVAVVEEPVRDGFPLAGVDGVVSDRSDLLLGVYVADCCAVYLVDPERHAFGLLHAGKRGTELGIVPGAIETMIRRFGSRPGELRVQLSPCIRPPDYEVDFAAEIRRQCEDAGVPAGQVYDEGVSTAQDPGRYYSYRMEKGKTGRMLALLGRRPESE